MARWVFWMLLTLLSWGIWAVLSRLIGGDVSPAQSQAMSTLGLAPIIVALAAIKAPKTPGRRRLGVLLAFGAGVVSCLGNIAYYAALGDAKAATIVPLTALYPAVTILLAVPLLSERVSQIQWVGMGLSLIAIVLFNAPGEQHGISLWMLAALIAVVLWGVASLMQKASTSHLSGTQSALWFLMAFLPIGVGVIPLDPLPSAVATETWALAAALGFTLGCGNLTILLAYAAGGKAAVIAPLSGLYPIVSIPIAILGFGERIGARESVGIALALTAVVMLAYAPEPQDAGATKI